jgi:hypothetical protein
MTHFRKIATKKYMGLKHYVANCTKFRAIIAKLLVRFPGLKARLAVPEQLSPRARKIYADLKTAIEQHRKGQL